MDAVHTNVIKRNGEEVNFDLDKIVNAINAANKGWNDMKDWLKKGYQPEEEQA